KLPMSRPNTNASRASITGSPDGGGLSCEDAPIGFQGTGDHAVHGKPLDDGTAGGIADLPGFFGVIHQATDGGEDGGLVVVDEESVLAVADDFGESADAAGDHRHGGRHGEQSAGAEALAVGDVDHNGGLR